MFHLTVTMYWKSKSCSQKFSNPAWWCRSFEKRGWAPNEVQSFVFNVKLCIFWISNLQQKHPNPQKTWSTSVLFCTSLLLKLNRRWHLPLHSREQENTASAWFRLCCSWTVQRLNLTYLVFCGLDLFCGLPEWISLSTGSEEQIGQCTRRRTTMEAVGNVHKYPGICCGCCNTVTCQITVGLRLLVSMFYVHFPERVSFYWLNF